MTRGENLPRPRALLLCVFALEVLVFAVGLTVFGLGIGLLVAGLLAWLHPVHVAFAWTSTLGGIGLIGGGAACAALAWLAIGAVVPVLGEAALLRYGALSPAARSLRFLAAIGILLALICLPFAAAIRAGGA
jgi:hypothetical protein